jgi:hypothetical protein
MSGDDVAIHGEIVLPVDEAHRHLRKAYGQLESDYWAIADAVHEARVAEVWLRDDRAHEARYRQIMTDRNLPSIFSAYMYDEFGVSESASQYSDLAGRIREAVDNTPTGVGVDWSRFTLAAVRPIGAAIINTYDAADVGAALVTAQRLADKELTARQVADEVVTPVKPSHVRAALVQHGLTPPRAKGLDEMEQAERRAAQLNRAEAKARSGLGYLVTERQRKLATEIIVATIRRLSDHAPSLAAIRAVLDEVAP